eukprot:1148811-Pelagomonas_calceolata.AAC.3
MYNLSFPSDAIDTVKRVTRVTRVTRGVGLQPENLADRLLKSIDLKISEKVKARHTVKNLLLKRHTPEFASLLGRPIYKWSPHRKGQHPRGHPLSLPFPHIHETPPTLAPCWWAAL